jgi:hypothetical protein
MTTTTVKTSLTTSKHQHCPTCNRYVKVNNSHSNYVCEKCVIKATDQDGKNLSFYSITEDGNGIQGKYTESGNLYRSTFCFIKGIKCRAIETVLYGILILPFKPRKRKPKDALTISKSETSLI